jgi:hypothetical protein
MIAAAGPTALPVPMRANSRIAEKSIVAMVTPEIGLFELPTIPAIYAATEEKRNPAMSITIAITNDGPTLLVIYK